MILEETLSQTAADDGIVVHVLGSGSGLPTAERDTCGLLLGDRDGWTLAECPGSVVHKLARLGLSPCDLRRVVLTHDHVDHIYGLPHLLQAMAIAGAPAFLELRAPAQTLHTVDDMVRTFGLDGEHYPRLEMREIELRPGHAPLALDGTRLRVAPAAHSRETAALRFGTDEVSVCYSSDTRPSNDVNRLARGTDIFMHDCGGPHRRRAAFSSGHSSALEAASAASAAGAKRLVLMHLGSRTDDELQECLAEARNVFEGPVMLAEDGRTWNLPERSFISPESGRAAVR